MSTRSPPAPLIRRKKNSASAAFSKHYNNDLTLDAGRGLRIRPAGSAMRRGHSFANIPLVACASAVANLVHAAH